MRDENVTDYLSVIQKYLKNIRRMAFCVKKFVPPKKYLGGKNMQSTHEEATS